MKYKLLVCDVDGTLIPNTQHGMPSEKVINAIKKANKKINVSIATARSHSQIMHIINPLQLSTPCIITGGAQIINPQTKEILLEKTILSSDIKEITKIGNMLNIRFTIADAAYEEEIIYSKEYKPKRPLDMYSQPIEIKKAQEFIEKISHISTVEAHKALGWEEKEKVHIVLTNPEASKQYGVLELSKILGITKEEIIGVGEGYNDFSFLMSCGTKIAMGNAIDAIKQIADYVVPSVEEDGIAFLVEKFIL
ncbi:MAG TPA: HAD-IIB family hydrolase [Patescibacteria group bacterium]